MGWGVGSGDQFYFVNDAAKKRLGVDSSVEDMAVENVGAAIDDLRNILHAQLEPILS